jgi:phosphoserine phosphatase RsbU/P
MTTMAKPGLKTPERLSVLVVEDDPHVRQLLADTLGEWGYQVSTAADGQEAWDFFAGPRPPHIVVTDLFMPCVDGLELCRRIRARRQTEYVYILVLTGQDDSTNRFDALFAGADEFLAKPWQDAELRARIRAGERIIRLEWDLRDRLLRLEEANRQVVQSQERLRRDLFAVAKIQTSLLPDTLPSIPGVNIAWDYRPRCELAGDGLNVFRLDEHHVAFYVLDVSGSGTPAALLSVSLSRSLSPYPTQSKLLKCLVEPQPGYRLRSPTEVLSDLNATFPLDEERAQYFTIFYGMYHLGTRELRYAVAGHPTPILVRPGQSPCHLPGGGLPIGFSEEATFSEEQVQLLPGDRLFLYSDGLIDVPDGSRRLLGRQGLATLLAGLDGVPVKACVEQIVHRTLQWGGCEEFFDDVSLLALEILPE